MKYVITDNRLPFSAKKALLAEGFYTIEMPKWDRLQEPVSAHPDMLLFVAKNRIITHIDYFNIAKDSFELMKTCGYEIILSNEEISSKYPNDILFNCVEIGGFIFGKISNTSKHITDYAKRGGKELISVKQGYAKCSVAKVCENAAITADVSLYKAMSAVGIDVLLISPDGISLDGYDRGFIGGCSGCTDDKIYFTGNIDLHPDSDRIKDFCTIHGKAAVSLSNETLFDGGSLFFI